MIDYREILRCNSLGYTNRRIEVAVQNSHHTIESTHYLPFTFETL